MAITATWDETTPNNATDICTIDDAIVAFKTGVRERMRNGGHIWETAFPSTDQEAGRHACNVEFASGGTGAVAHEWYVYDTDGSTKVLTIKGAAHASPGLQLVAGTLTAPAVTISGTLTVTGNTDFTAVPLSQGEIVDGALSAFGNANGANILGALSANHVLATLTFSTATVPGRVLAFFTMRYNGNVTAGTFTIKMQVDRQNNGTWVDLAGMPTQAYADISSPRIYGTHVFDLFGTLNGATAGYRVVANHSSGTNNYNMSDITLTTLELRR